MEQFNYTDGKLLDMDVYPHFLSPKESNSIYNYLENNVKWSKSITKGRRTHQDYGDEGVSYVLNIRGNKLVRNVINWDTLPPLLKLKKKIEKYASPIGTKYDYCVIQRYPSGKVGILPHRDREMKNGTHIAGISIGEQRILKMGAPYYSKYEDFEVPLPHGSLYIFNPPTNNHWSHCIQKDNTKKPRISITFRYLGEL